jgi:hypothetical protein
MAQDEKSIIRSLLDPTIKIDRLEIEDLWQGTSDKLPAEQRGKTMGQQIQNELGVDYPFISINDYVFDSNEIRFFRIDATEFLPILSFTFQLKKSDAFRSQSYPKDGDIVNVFIRAKNDSFKPIRNDYIITNVSSGPGGVENSGGMTTITAELFVPHLRDQVIKTYKGSSFDVLKKIAQDLRLGFATNETSTNDLQTWLCPSSTWLRLINHVVEASWKDDRSFYKCFIDVYYHLNFINVNNQLEGEGQLASGILDSTIMKDYYSNDIGTMKESETKTGKFITNIDSFDGTNMFCRSYETKNESTRINQEHGYKYNVQFFDMKSLKYWNIFVDPITSAGSENKKIILKGRTFPKNTDQSKDGKSPSENDYWKTQNRYVWKGIQSTNVHDKYTYAIAHNERNLLELRKLYLEVNVERWNPNIYMGEKVPLLFISQADVMKANLDAQGEDRKIINVSPGEPAVLDQFYSGYYMVNGMTITYNVDGTQYAYNKEQNGGFGTPTFFQTFVMTRREWPTPLG